jgi:hypothetical protein
MPALAGNRYPNCGSDPGKCQIRSLAFCKPAKPLSDSRSGMRTASDPLFYRAFSDNHLDSPERQRQPVAETGDRYAEHRNVGRP